MYFSVVTWSWKTVNLCRIFPLVPVYFKV